ncbi:MAG: TraB/GumN family protein [Alkalispirochaetaceae bacterium]
MSETITRLQLGERTVVLVGTAHVSRESVNEVESIIREESPDRVCVEIDAQRYKAISEGTSWASMDIYKIIKEGKAFLLLGNLVLQAFQRRMGVDLGVKPGEEMRAAIRVSKELEIPFSFVDREIQTTLRRAWAKSSLWGKNKLLAALLSSVFTNEKLTEEEIEKLKHKSELETMLDELADYLPAAKQVLIDERDQYLATRIFESEGEKVVAVVGAGHVPGIINWLEALQQGEREADLSAVDHVPPPSAAAQALKWVIPAVVAGLIIYGFVNSGWTGGLEALTRWVLVNGTLSAIGAAVALAHPLTIAASFLAAPVTSMNPTIGVGLVTGLLESIFRKPRVADLEALPEDILSLKGFFTNRFTHILIVFFFSTIGSAIGTFVALPFLFPGR